MQLNMTFVMAGLKEIGTDEKLIEAIYPDPISLTGSDRMLTHMAHFIRTSTAELEAKDSSMERKVQLDSLTQIYNRSQIEAELQEALLMTKGNERRFAVIMMDIDDFKSINDRFGHDIGDIALKSLAYILKESVRTTDAAGRWGGDEFFLLLQKTDAQGAYIVAERIRKAIQTGKTLPDGSRFTVIIGITDAKPDDTIMSIFKRADQALYAAKAIEGKDSVVDR